MTTGFTMTSHILCPRLTPESHGGSLSASATAATHAILRHRQQESWLELEACAHDRPVAVSLVWILACVEEGRLLPVPPGDKVGPALDDILRASVRQMHDALRRTALVRSRGS